MREFRSQGSGVQDSEFSRDAKAERCSSFIVHRSSFANSESPALLRGFDHTKDQSYVLFGVAREYLPRMLFPLGGYHKPEIRALARDLNLRVADKRDSQEICFVASGDHAEFVRHRRATDSSTAGDIALADGTVVGQHAGIEGFTIGQRKGLRLAMGEPYYVTKIEADTRRVVIGRREELARHELTANRVNWLIDPTSRLRFAQTCKSATTAPPRRRWSSRLPAIASACSSTTRATASPPVRPQFATTTSAYSAAAGLNNSPPKTSSATLCRRRTKREENCGGW